MAHINEPPKQQIFHDAKRKRKTDRKHHRNAKDLGTGFEILECGAVRDCKALRNRPARLNKTLSDETIFMLNPVGQFSFL
jgi:hypothetical protein